VGVENTNAGLAWAPPTYQMEDPNPFPSGAVTPAHCSSLKTGTTERRWEAFDGFRFDEEGTLPVLQFFSGLKHTQGHLAGEPFELTPEQLWLVREAYGWIRISDGARKFRIVFVEMGRGNGKSQLGAGIAGYMLLADRELNPEVVGVAYTRDQARKYCFNRMKAMIQVNPSLMSLVDLYKTEIRRRESSQWGGIYEAVSSDVNNNWGGAPHCVVFDEVHTQKNRELWDAMETALGKRRQPMMWGFTTAGWDRNSLCYELHSKTVEMAKGNYIEDEFLGVIWAANEEDDWTDPVVWQKANPMMGVAFKEDFLHSKAEKAINTPAFQNTFRTMYLSQWVGGESAFISMPVWDENDHITPLPAPGKRTAFGGLDLSSTTDLSAFSVVCKNGDRVEIHLQMYAPRLGLVERERRDRLPYREWVRLGWLTLCNGETIDQEVIKADVYRAMDEWDLKDVAYDRWNASKLVREMSDEGVKLVEFGQGYANMSAPTKSLLQLVVERKIMTGGNAALRAQISNTSALTDAADNVKPDKSKSSTRIDGVVATIMALDGLNRRGRPERRSAYEDDEDDVDNESEEEAQEEEELVEPTTPSFRTRRSAYEEEESEED